LLLDLLDLSDEAVRTREDTLPCGGGAVNGIVDAAVARGIRELVENRPVFLDDF